MREMGVVAINNTRERERERGCIVIVVLVVLDFGGM